MTIKRRMIQQIILIFFSMNFLNMEGRILFGLFVLSFFLQSRKRMTLTRNFILLLCFSVFFYLAAMIYNPTMMTYYLLPFLLGPVMGYSIGYSLVEDNSISSIECGGKTLKSLIYCITFGRFFHGLLNFIISKGYSGFNRNGIDIWTRTVLSATGQGALMTMCIGLTFYGLIIVKKDSMLEKTIILFAVFMSLLNSVLSASRTALFIMAIVFLFCTLISIIKSNIPINTRRRIIFGILVFSLIAVLLFQRNIFGIRNFWITSPLYDRINTITSYESGDIARRSSIEDALIVGIIHPFGDGDMGTTAHNLWLDIFRQTGWLTSILLLCFTIVSIKNVMQVWKNNNASIEIKYLVISVFLSMLLNFSFEPIMKGMPYYFVSFCILSGGVEKYLHLIEVDNTNRKH